MPSYTLEIEAIGLFLLSSPSLEIWEDGQLNSTHSIGLLGTSISTTITYSGSVPSSLALTFNDGSGEGGRSIELISVKINGQSVSDGNFLSLSTLTNGVSAVVDVVGSSFLFDETEPAASEFTNGATKVMTTAGDTFRNYTRDTDQVIDASNGNDKLFLGGGNDKITGGQGNDLIRGGGGNDLLFGDSGADRIYGEDGDDTIYGGDNDDRLYGNDGNDTIHGGHGNDKLFGHNGNDIMTGGIGNDRLTGGNGDDYLFGGAGTDTLSGGSGNDTLDGGTGNDLAYGGAGIDKMDGGDGDDTLVGDAGNDVINGGAGDDLLIGFADDDTIYGGADNDELYGGTGDDLLYGGAGNDELYGGLGNDVGDGGDGTDTMTWTGNWADYSISLSGSIYTLVDNVGTDGTDTATLIENFVFADGTRTTADILAPPVITSNGGGATASITIAENTTAVTTVTVASPGSITYSISGGVDASLFTINASTGVLSFLSAADYETPLDSGTNNIYDVQVTASNGGTTDIQNITVSITDVNEGDVGTGPGGAGTVTVGGSVTYDVDTGGDRDWFAVDLVAGERYAIWARGAPTEAGASTDPRIYNIYESDGTTVASGGDDDGGVGYESLLYFTPSSSGTYYIDAGAYGTRTGTITLSVFEGGSSISGNNNANTLNGSADADYLRGRNGDDILNGGDGSDILEGGGNDDTLTGGNGADVLYGGTGADTFVFTAIDASDSIVDFNTGQGDVLDVSSILTGFVNGVSDIDDFVQFTTSGNDTIMRVDADGAVGGSNFVEVAVLLGNTGEVVQTLHDNGDIIT